MSRLIAESKLPDTPVKAYLALDGVWGVLQLQALDGPECGADRIKLPRTRLLVTIDDLQFHGEFAQHVEAFVELVTNEQGHVDGFFSGDFLRVGPWRLGVVIMGLGGVLPGGTGLDGAALTGAGCWCGWVLAPSDLSGITIICLPLLWKRRGAI
jgi:hypothetical protein